MKSRFCPSPTGLLHLGNMRTALFNALVAYAQNGCFLLRIEDTDRVRSKEDYAQALMNDLRWLGLLWQEGPEIEGSAGPYWQSQREVIYAKYYQQLEAQNDAYSCFCSEEQLALNRKVQRASGQAPRYPGTCVNLSPAEIEQKRNQGLQATLRFKVPSGQRIEFDDLVRGKQTFNSDDLGDFIIRRTDGGAAFMYCNAIDDSLMGVTLALRGEDHLTNTPRQLLILKALGLTAPQYGHLSLLLGTDGAPLSKRNGSRSIDDMRQEGILPLALLNYLSRLGHYYESDALLSLSDLVKQFSLKALGKSPARYDEAQLRHWQKEAVLQSDDETLWQWMNENTRQIVTESNKQSFIESVRSNLLFPKDAELWATLLFTDTVEYGHEEKVILKQAGLDFFETVLEALSVTGTDFKAIVEYVKHKHDLKGMQLYMPLRVALTGQQHGPEMVRLLPLLGQIRAQRRIEYALFSI